jgi:RNA recognition motif-containing protein
LSGFCFAQGYSLIEYKTYEEAAKAVQEMDGASVMEQKVNVGWAFKPTPAGSNARGGMGRGGGRGGFVSSVVFFSFMSIIFASRVPICVFAIQSSAAPAISVAAASMRRSRRVRA